MQVGVPKEIKDNEYRVGLIPSTVEELTRRGHRVLVETRAGEGAGIADAEYAEAGAEIAPSAQDVFARAELIVKVKEPLASERALLRPDHVLFTYLHLAADLAQTMDLLASGVTAIAYETVTEAGGQLPLLRPMSEVAGRMATQVGAQFLERSNGGRGILLGGVPGVLPAQVLVIGAGSVGSNATFIAVGMGADVTVTASALDSLRAVTERFGSSVRTVASSRQAIETLCRSADLVVGAALVPGAVAPKLISAATVKQMKAGSVIVDVAIDQGGNAETSRPTTHSQPTFVVDGVVHYCVTNMPGAVPRTSTYALTNATLPFVIALADKGWRRAMTDDTHLREGLNIHDRQVTHPAVAQAFGMHHLPAAQALSDGGLTGADG
jgi:alanine dehydrogenase